MSIWASLYFGAVLIVAAISDVRSFRIPNVLPAILALGALVLATPETGGEWASRFTSVLAVGGFAMGLYMANGLGGGDVKLLAAAALWAPLSTLPAFILSLGLAGGLQALAVMAWTRWRAAGALAGGAPAAEPAAPARMPYAVSIAAAGLFWLWWEAVGRAAAG
ncbi:prepilin peptidase [Caulobacter sp. 17J80-11]|uniref:A24 family peptidase n=1 Tax=Caulobacter sp. 17J80-11 TaxID=2763502 RepID=UPI001653ED3B|nr:prepilin peptidase [Caulobacter sp. 17J80-11]MBC6982414.1 prepilin peptidase [Caulobacter sp. 17J80-11]